MPDDEIEPEDDAEDVEDGDSGDTAYRKRAKRLRHRLDSWLRASPYLASMPRQVVRVLVECDDICAQLYEEYSTGHDPAIAKLWIAASHQREVVLKLLAVEDTEE